MSSETASSTCVGTSTSSLPQAVHQQQQEQQQQQLMLTGQSSFVSATVASTDGEEDTRSMAAADMDLVNGLNPWLPAYGFQLQHQQHNQHFQPTHEDLRANDAALVQQVDFLETIVEETSDDLQSDSDRSGTTYWLGSDSETESVIHIKASQRVADERPDGSGSECNSVVPKKRRRRNASQDRDASVTLADEQWTSPRSSRSSESSSRSSSLLQFESLERTCATVSPSGYSYDSLEYSNRSNSHFENTSPDSLEEDCDEEEVEEERTRNERVNGFPVNGRNGFAKLRPYRSFESLDTCHKSEVTLCSDLSNGFSASFYSKTSNDLSAGGRRNDRDQRDFWHENEPYEEDDEYEEDDDEEDIEEEEETSEGHESRRYDTYGDRVGLLSFTDCNVPSFSTSLDFRNTIDLREIGIETKRDAVLDLKAGQVSACSLLLASSASSRLLQTTRLNIAGVVDGCGVSGVGCGSGSNMASGSLSGSGLLHHHHQHHHHHHPQRQQQQQHQHQRGWSNSSDFNFRFTDKSRSAPSLPSGFDESSSSAYPSGRSPRSSDYYPGTSIGTVSSSSLFENYTRVASVPVDLNLCGRDNEDVTNIRDNESTEEYDQDVTITNVNDADDREPLENRLKVVPHEMADDSGVSAQSSIESSKSSERTDTSMSISSSSSSSYRRLRDVGDNDDGKALTSSVRTQSRPEVTEVNTEDAAGSSLLSTIDADAVQAAKMHLEHEKVIASSDEGDEAEEEEDEDTVEDVSESGVAVSTSSRDPEPPRSTVKTQDRGHSVLEIAMAMENDIDAVVDEAIRQFKREVEEATGAGGNTALLAMEAMQRLSSDRQKPGKPNRRVKNNASYELAQQFEIDERNFGHVGRMTSCAEDDVESAPGSPGGSQSNRRRVLNNASYELAQQQDYIKLLQSKARPFQRMDACDERPEVPRPTIACGIKVADIVREMSRDPNSSVATSGIFSEEETVPEERKVNDVFAKNSGDQQVFAGRHDDRQHNHVSPQSKNAEYADQQHQQQQDSIIGQIKKNSDLFSLYGESGSDARTVGRVEANNDDEVDYPCLETKPILNNSDILDVDVRRTVALDKGTPRMRESRTTNSNRDEDRERSSGTENEEDSQRYYEELTNELEEPPNRGLLFLGEFYPETKNHISRVEKSSLSSELEEFHKNEIEALAAENNDKSTTNREKIDRIEREPAGERLWRVVVEKRQCSSSESSASERTEGPERGIEDSIESVVEAATVSARAVVVEEASNDAEVEEAMRRRRKECAYVAATGTVGLNSTGTTVHAVACAVTPVTRASPPRLITSDRSGVGSSLERNGGSGTDDENRGTNANNSESVVVRREDKDDHGIDGDDEEEEEVDEQLDCKTIETTTKKTKSSGSPEMSATAAKRLAMASHPGPPRNNNDHSAVTTKNDLAPHKNNNSPVASSPVNERKKGGLGGFLQRFSRLRFSGRSKVPRSEVTKKNEAVVVGVEQPVNRNAGVKLMDEQPGTTRRKKEPDYIIIPLHASEDERRTAETQEDGRDEGDVEIRSKPRRSTDLERSASCASPNGRPPVSSKPPLPPSHHQGGGGARSGGATTPTSRSSSGVGGTRRRAATDLGSSAAIEMAKARAMQAAQEPRPVGLLETDLDAAEPAVLHVDLSGNGASAGGHAATSCNNQAAGKKTRSLLNLNHTSSRQGRDGNHHLVNDNALRVPQSPGSGCRNTSDHQDHHHNSVGNCINQRPHKSMEFLLDKENLHFVKPPENELQKVGERVPSEHELRVQRSLQRLNVPDWYKNSPAARDGFRLKRHSDASQHGGWRSLGSKTTSLSSLSSSSNRQPTTGVLLSPSPTPPVFSRWSTSLLNSAGSSPASSARSSFNHRQPYLGWRSQERLANPRTPAERLAQGILPQLQSTKKQQQQQQQQHQQQQQKEQTNQQLEVRNSIKEVTSAIVHYVQSGQEVAGGGRLSPRPRPDDWDDRGGARSTSPRGSVKLCWMESSFVGSRPVDSPETPMSLATDTECCAGCNATGNESCSCVDSATSGLYLDLTPTRDEPQQNLRGSGGQQNQQHGTRSLCPSPSSSSAYHQQLQHHHHAHHQQQQQQQQYQRHHRGSGQSEDEEAMATAALLRNKPSPGSTTLEDVLDSLLGLPSASRTPSPGPGPLSGSTSIRHHRAAAASAGQPSANAGKSCSDLRQDLQESARGGTPDSPGATNADTPRASSYYVGELVRRKSEGSDIVPPHRSSSRTSNLRNRRVSFDNAQNNDGATVAVTLAEKLVRCRNNKCNNATTVAEARRVYKSCHNCTCLYCSRECRRAHWQRHRRTCLHSRAGTLCRQVLSSAKEDPATLRHISALAQRGYASHGRGAVKCFFSSPEVAEQFVSNGFVDLGEPTYVRWSDLLPSEMGAELYAEVMRLCKSYNPETRLVLYVAVCVVSEVPSSGAVRWERQLVSRCGKIRLDSSCRQPTITTSTTASPQGRQQTASPCNITREMDSPETLVLTSMPERDGQNTPRSAREIGFTNIQRQLRLRGVSLRRHFPQVYTKLCSYVDGTVDKFAPVTIYPRDQASGKSFMCIIMLDAEPERLQLLPTDSSRVRTVDISVEQE